MDGENFDEIGMKESDEFRSFAGHGCGRSGRITQKRHLAEKVSGLQIRKSQRMLCFVVQDDLDAARPDDVDAGAGFAFQEDRLLRLICSDMNHALKDSQFFGCEFLEQRDVLQDVRQGFVTRDEPKDVCPNPVSLHNLRIVAWGYELATRARRGSAQGG